MMVFRPIQAQLYTFNYLYTHGGVFRGLHIPQFAHGAIIRMGVSKILGVYSNSYGNEFLNRAYRLRGMRAFLHIGFWFLRYFLCV